MINLVKLKDVCTKITDGSHYSPVGTSQGVPMLSVKDMRENGFSYTDCKYISTRDYLDLKKNDCKPLKDDVLIAKDGSYLKHVFVIKNEIDQAILSSIGILRPNTEIINPSYLKYYLQNNTIKKEVAKKYVSGSALPRIILKNFGEISILKPELNLQNNIANFLSMLDDKIEINNRINTELEKMTRTLYDYWFIQFDFPDANGKPYKSSGGQMAYSDPLKREIPTGWKATKLDEVIARSGTGLNPRTNFKLGKGKNYYVTIKNVENGKIVLDDKCDKIDDQALEIIQRRSDLQVGDILFTSIQPVGVTYLIHEKPRNWNINESVFTIRPNYQKVSSDYLYMLLSSEEMKIYTTNSSAGSVHKGIRHGVLKDFNATLAPKDIIDNFTEIVNPILKKMNHNDQESQKLAELRDWLLPMLMNGQVRVE